MSDTILAAVIGAFALIIAAVLTSPFVCELYKEWRATRQQQPPNQDAEPHC